MIISLQSVCKSYLQELSIVDVLDQVSVDFTQGQSYAIVGASGSGKSTLIHLIAGVDKPTSGAVFMQNQSISTLTTAQIALFFQKNISIVFQQACLFAELTVLENVMLKAILAGEVTGESHQHARNLLQEVDLADKSSVYPATLSGGQQQRIAILRAIFMVPHFLLVDEPTGNLDENSGEKVIDLLLYYQKKYDMGLIMSTHNQQIAKRMQVVYKVEDKKLHSVIL